MFEASLGHVARPRFKIKKECWGCSSVVACPWGQSPAWQGVKEGKRKEGRKRKKDIAFRLDFIEGNFPSECHSKEEHAKMQQGKTKTNYSS